MPSIVVSMFMGGSMTDFEPFRLWMGLLGFAGVGSLVYRFILFRRTGAHYIYRLDRIIPRDPDAYDLILLPLRQRMSYAPGKFVYMSIAEGGRWSSEMHPFSLSSTPVKQEVRLSVCEVGDFTHRLRHLKPGHQIGLYGPYGSFTMHSVTSFERVICIGAGIGVTPFLGMLEFERTNADQCGPIVRDDRST